MLGAVLLLAGLFVALAPSAPRDGAWYYDGSLYPFQATVVAHRTATSDDGSWSTDDQALAGSGRVQILNDRGVVVSEAVLPRRGVLAGGSLGDCAFTVQAVARNEDRVYGWRSTLSK